MKYSNHRTYRDRSIVEEVVVTKKVVTVKKQKKIKQLLSNLFKKISP